MKARLLTALALTALIAGCGGAPGDDGGDDAASLTVLMRSSKDFATRSILTFGYFAWNSLLSCSICLR